jgi:hypothetical protein
MKFHRIAGGLSAAALLALAVAACGGGYGSSTTSAPVATATPSGPAATGTIFIALGDDATVGIGTIACGVTIPSTNCPSGPASGAGTGRTSTAGVAVNGYAQQLATGMNNLHSTQTFSFVPLGVTGALVGNEPVPASPQNDIIANVTQAQQIPGVVSAARAQLARVAISVFAGINDVADAYFTQQCGGATTGAGGSIATPCGASGTTLPASTTSPRTGSLYAGYLNLFKSIAATAPDAVLIVGVPDLSTFPRFKAALTAAQLNTLSADTGLANAAMQAAASDAGLKFALTNIVQAAINSPGTFNAGTSFSSDQFHYTDPGYAAIAGAAFAAFTATFPTF